MLGWEFFVSEQNEAGGAEARANRPVLARWRAGLGGTNWLKELVAQGIAKFLDGDGYPTRYVISAGALIREIAEGIPKHTGPPAFGDNYFLPGGWVGETQIDIASLRALDPFTLLLVEAWDQS